MKSFLCIITKKSEVVKKKFIGLPIGSSFLLPTVLPPIVLEKEEMEQGKSFSRERKENENRRKNKSLGFRAHWKINDEICHSQYCGNVGGSPI